MRSSISTAVTSFSVFGPARLAVVLVMAGLSSACEQDVRDADFYEDVKAAYEECNEAEIKYLTAKQGMQSVFEPCGSNRFLNLSLKFFDVTL